MKHAEPASLAIRRRQSVSDEDPECYLLTFMMKANQTKCMKNLNM